MAEKRQKPSDLLARMGRSLEVAAPITTDHLAEVASHDGDPAEEARLAGIVALPERDLPVEPVTEPAVPVVPVVPEPVAPHDDVVSDVPPLREPVPPVSDVSVPLETPPFQEPVPPTTLPVAPVTPAETASGEKPAQSEKPKRSRKDKLPRRLPGPKDSVRFSLDLERSRHKEFKTFSLLEAEIDAAVVGRVLVEMMLEDPALKARVLARVAQLKSEYLANS